MPSCPFKDGLGGSVWDVSCGKAGQSYQPLQNETKNRGPSVQVSAHPSKKHVQHMLNVDVSGLELYLHLSVWQHPASVKWIWGSSLTKLINRLMHGAFDWHPCSLISPCQMKSNLNGRVCVCVMLCLRLQNLRLVLANSSSFSCIGPNNTPTEARVRSARNPSRKQT